MEQRLFCAPESQLIGVQIDDMKKKRLIMEMHARDHTWTWDFEQLRLAKDALVVPKTSD